LNLHWVAAATKIVVPMAHIAIAWTLSKGVADPIIDTTSLKNQEATVETVKVN